jgi:Transposase, Mutator family
VTLDGDRDVLGLWFQDTEGAKFWMQVLVRHEALLNRMEVEDHHRLVVAAAGQKLRAARSGRRREGRKAALTTTGLVGTARRPGPGKRDRKVYVRNQRSKAPQCIHQLETWRIWAGKRHNLTAYRTAVGAPGPVVPAGRVAMRKVCGVLVDGRRSKAGHRPCQSILW